MHFVLQTPSLQRIAQVKIVAALLNRLDIITRITQTLYCLPRNPRSSPEERRKWKEIEDLVMSKLSALPLPRRCKTELLCLVKPLGNEITVWTRNYRSCFTNYSTLLDVLFGKQVMRWTMRGTVDNAKTAELLVKDERVDLEKRYEMACVNCLEDEARRLILLIPEKRRREYINRVRNLFGVKCHVLITFFTRALSGQGPEQPWADHFQCPTMHFRVESFNKRLFGEMLCRGTRATCEYFFNKLSQGEKEQVLVECQARMLRHYMEPPACNLMYYLSLMNEEQQRHMFERYTDALLKCLLGWPMHALFVEAAECGWQFMNNQQGSQVLCAIIDKIRCGFEDYDYGQLFRECWRSSRDDCKRHFLSDRGYLVGLINTKEDELIKLVFNEAPWNCLKVLVENCYNEISGVLREEKVISDAALLECKEKAALESLKSKEDEEKRLRSQYLSRLIDTVMENRIQSRSWQPRRD